MKKFKDPVKLFKMVMKLINIFDDYSSKVDAYFQSDENKMNNPELYSYYQELIINLKGLDLH